MNSFEQRLSLQRPLLLDGGLATQIQATGQELHPTLWSTGLLIDTRDAIATAHDAFVAAGAEIIATATYQGSREGFMRLGLSQTEADELMRGSVALARQSLKKHGANKGMVAASLGPWGACQVDGSEYTGHYEVTAQELTAFHRQRFELMDDAGADVLALETIPNLQEARVLAETLSGVNTPAWVSFCCRDDSHLSDGTPIEVAAKLFAGHSRVKALGINCTAPRHLHGLLERLRQAVPGLPVLVYPNSGETYDVSTQRWDGEVAVTAAGSAARDWWQAGAKGVGGCCRMGSSHIAAMAQTIKEDFPA